MCPTRRFDEDSTKGPRTPELQRELQVAHGRFVEMAEGLLVARVPDPTSRSVAAQMLVALIDSTVHQVVLRQHEPDHRQAALDLMQSAANAVVDSAAAESRR